MPYDNETRVEYLERNIAEVRAAIREEIHRSHNGTFSDERIRLEGLARRMTAELNAIRPFKPVKNGPSWVVAFNGKFITDEAGEYLTFPTEAQAQRYINGLTVGEVA